MLAFTVTCQTCQGEPDGFQSLRISPHPIVESSRRSPAFRSQRYVRTLFAAMIARARTTLNLALAASQTKPALLTGL